MDKTNLKTALKLTMPALGSRTLLPGTDCFHVTPDRITTFNGSIALSAPFGFTFPVTGAIPGETFLKFINDLDKEFELTSNSPDSLVINYGKSKTEFSVQAIDTAYLNDVEEDSSKTYLPTNVLFAAGLKRCMLSIGGSKGGEAGIYLFIKDDECRMYSSTGFTASRFVFPIENFPETLQIFLPAAFCELLIYLYDVLNREPTEVCVTEKYIRATFGDVTLRSGFYANPVNTELASMLDDCIAEVPLVELPIAFKESLKRAEIIAGDKEEVLISYGTDNNSTVHVDTKGVSGQKLNDLIDLSYPLDGSLNINIRHLHKIIEGCDQIGFNSNYLVVEGKEGYFDYMVSARIGNN